MLKKRSDFVSNSSSSSFIVVDEGNVHESFKDEHLSWRDYADKFLEREVCDPIYDMSYSWSPYGGNDTDPRRRIRIISEKCLLEAYGRNDGIWPAVLERDAALVEEIAGAIEKVREINGEKEPDLFKDGKKSDEFANAWRRVHWDKRQAAEGELRKLCETVKRHVFEALEPAYGKWMFWYAEFGNDGNGIDESEAYGKMDETKWHRVFGNH